MSARSIVTSFLGSFVVGPFIVGSITVNLLHAGVIYVGPALSGAPFQQIQPALDVAQPGDVVIVLPKPLSYYDAFTLTKPVFVVGQAPCFANASVLGIPAGSTAGVCGMSGAVSVDTCDGAVIVQNVTGSVSAQHSARVWVLDSMLNGYSGYKQDGICHFAEAALSSVASTVWIANSTLRGGKTSNDCSIFFGASGIRAIDSSVYIARTQSFGADGTFAFSGYGTPDGLYATRSAIKYAGGPNSLLMGGSMSIGGTPGSGMTLESSSLAFLGADAYVTAGWTGATQGPIAIHVDATSDVVQLPALLPTLAAAPAVAHLGASLTLATSGTPADLVFTFAAFQLGPDLAIPGIDGVAVLAPASALLLDTGKLDASGAHAIPLTVPNDAALLGLVAFVQTVELASTAGAFSNPACLPLVP